MDKVYAAQLAEAKASAEQYGGRRDYEDNVKMQPPVDSAYESLSRSRGELQDMVSLLAERLGKVMTIPTPDGREPEEAENVACSVLTHNLRLEARELQFTTSRLRRMIDNLEL